MTPSCATCQQPAGFLHKPTGRALCAKHAADLFYAGCEFLRPGDKATEPKAEMPEWMRKMFGGRA